MSTEQQQGEGKMAGERQIQWKRALILRTEKRKENFSNKKSYSSVNVNK
jgi:hypothetical protein